MRVAKLRGVAIAMTWMLGSACAVDDGETGDADETRGESTGGTSTTTSTTTGPTTTTSPETTVADTGSETASETGSGCPEIDPHDASGCMPLASDYQPLDSEGDPYATCISDGGTYELVAMTPSSIARTEAWEEIRALLLDAEPPSVEDFTMARTIYAMDEGIESRVLRREDLHYPPVPTGDCTEAANVMDYPDRCAGPAKIAPILNEAFAAGMTGEGDPAGNAARIDAALMWFFYLSTYKEASTCITAPQDCDSSWAYYCGGTQSDDGIGFAGQLRALDEAAHLAIFDGVLAARCWRDLYDVMMYPTYDDLPADGQMLSDQAREQLDNALQYGLAVVVRDRLVQQAMQCDTEAAASWEYLAVAGAILDREAGERDAGMAATLAALWQNDAPTADDIVAGVAALDAIFPCPQP